MGMRANLCGSNQRLIRMECVFEGQRGRRGIGLPLVQVENLSCATAHFVRDFSVLNYSVPYANDTLPGNLFFQKHFSFQNTAQKTYRKFEKPGKS